MYADNDSTSINRYLPPSKAHAGLFQFLPLGLRVQEKVEKLVDKHMAKLGGSAPVPFSKLGG